MLAVPSFKTHIWISLLEGREVVLPRQPANVASWFGQTQSVVGMPFNPQSQTSTAYPSPTESDALVTLTRPRLQPRQEPHEHLGGVASSTKPRALAHAGLHPGGRHFQHFGPIVTN